MSEKVQSIKGVHYETKIPISVQVKDGIVLEIETIKPDDDLPILAPGFVDLQINGHGGKDLNTLPLEDNLVKELTALLWKEGVTSYYPTIITNEKDLITAGMKAISKACKQNPAIRKSIPGIHLEGPFISPEDGPRGAHKKEFVREPDWDLFQEWQEAAEGRIKLITVSPEWPNITNFIKRCVAADVTVSIGHTAASVEQIQEAVQAGARLSTHLGNGSHHLLPRHQNYLWAQLSDDRLWASVIADSYHLPIPVLKTFLRAKKQKIMLVSDAVYLSGMEPGNYNTHIGGEVVLTNEGKLYQAGNPEGLAGSAQMLIHGVENLVKYNLTTLSEAWEMASIRPATFMDMKTQKGIQPGSPADLVLFKHNQNQIEILQTVKNGKIVYEI